LAFSRETIPEPMDEAMKQLVPVVVVLALWAGSPSRARAQIGGAPAGGVIAAPAAGATAAPVAVPAAAQPTTLWSFLGLSKQNLAACKAKYCQSQLSVLVSNSLAPARGLSGGLLPKCCPDVPNPADLAKMKEEGKLSPAEEAAAKIKADEAQAKARRAAIRYLGTVDCHYFPEAEKALIAGLLNDRNECVRLEAALALGHGCCCTKKTIEALQITVTGGTKLGNPGETSERVKAAAFAALQHCLARQTEPPVPRQPERPPETIRPPEVPEVQQARLVPRPSEDANAAQVVPGAGRTAAERTAVPAPSGVPPTGQRNLFQIFRQAVGTVNEPRPVLVNDDPIAPPQRPVEIPPDVQVLPAVHVNPPPTGSVSAAAPPRMALVRSR
jgi:hypothetical protein